MKIALDLHLDYDVESPDAAVELFLKEFNRGDYFMFVAASDAAHTLISANKGGIESYPIESDLKRG